MTWLQLANKTAIVTGAASGIGAAVANALIEESCRVVLVDQKDIHQTKNQKDNHQVSLKRRLASTSSIETLFIQCDVTCAEEVKQMIQKADQFAQQSQQHQNNDNLDLQASTLPTASSLQADFLVNCAGITKDNWTSKMSLDEWDSVINVNLSGTFLPCRYFLDSDRLKRRKERRQTISRSESMGKENEEEEELCIVNIGSIVSDFGNLGQVNYAASKGGVLSMTRALAKESVRHNIRVNTIQPGFIETPMVKSIPDHLRDDVILPKIPMGRFGKPEDVANAVVFLLSPRSSYITGESITVSGMISL